MKEKKHLRKWSKMRERKKCIVVIIIINISRVIFHEQRKQRLWYKKKWENLFYVLVETKHTSTISNILFLSSLIFTNTVGLQSWKSTSIKWHLKMFWFPTTNWYFFYLFFHRKFPTMTIRIYSYHFIHLRKEKSKKSKDD